MAKKIAKPALKPAPKPTPRPLPRPRPAQLDLVRSPNFDSAMAQQNYQNSLADLTARAQAGQFDVRRDAVGDAALPQSEIDKKYIDDGRGGRILNPVDAARVKSQFDQLQANIAANPGPARNFDIVPIRTPEFGDIARQLPPQRSFNPNAPSLMPIRTPGSDALNQDLANRGMGGGSAKRNPRFDSAMANQTYANLMRDQQARLASQQGQYTQGRLMGAPTEQPNPNAGKPLYFQALEGELQKQFLDKNPQLKPKPGTALNSQLMQENYAKFLQNQMAEVNKFNAANPQYAQDIRKPNPALARQSEQSFLEGLLDYSKVSPSQVKVLDQLKSGYLNQGQGVETQPSIPQNPQTETYNNLLQQGIQRSNTMNQDAASNFANMQAGAPIPQPAAPAKANPTMPIAGMGMQQPKATPVPRKFSTVNTPSARFG